jgi:uncharacterized protein (DUF4415 family)
MARDSAKAELIGSDLAKVDGHVIQPEEYEEAPEWTDEMFERADHYYGDKLIRRGRPPQRALPKEAIKLRIDADVLEHFRATGPGWQTRINEALRRAAEPEEIEPSKVMIRRSGPKAPFLKGKGSRKLTVRKPVVKRAPPKRA